MNLCLGDDCNDKLGTRRNDGWNRFRHFGMMLGLFFMLLFIIGSILLVVWIVKQFSPGGTHAHPPASDSLEILKERFAKGEVSKEEFADMKKELLK